MSTKFEVPAEAVPVLIAIFEEEGPQYTEAAEEMQGEDAANHRHFGELARGWVAQLRNGGAVEFGSEQDEHDFRALAGIEDDGDDASALASVLAALNRRRD